jgi:hypothetical protein
MLCGESDRHSEICDGASLLIHMIPANTGS